MAHPYNKHGDRIRKLFAAASREVVIVAPFMKVDALRSLLDVISRDVFVRCVTRWIPREIAAGVSDLEVLDMLEERGNCRLSLVDTLHAKIYIGDDDCLAGSSNVTHSGLGEGDTGGNIEVLVETVICNPGVKDTLDQIARSERRATRAMAESTRRLANSLNVLKTNTLGQNYVWFPCSRRPEAAFQFYQEPPIEHIGAADRYTVIDVANLELQVGLDRIRFNEGVRALLSAIPIAEDILVSSTDIMVRLSDVHAYIEALPETEFSVMDRWNAFVEWMVYFFPEEVMKQEITEIGLRRAKRIV